MPAKTAPPEYDLDIMRGIIEQAREAIWCIRFERPVDITAGEDATVDQIFSNPAVWTMCNAAMARAYELPSPSELNGRDVHFHWPRNTVNEAFIRAVIASGYHIDGAVSEDFRRDGTPVLMENDVRAHIEGGRLYRLWSSAPWHWDRVELGAVRKLVMFLLKDCCNGQPELCAPLIEEISKSCSTSGACCG